MIFKFYNFKIIFNFFYIQKNLFKKSLIVYNNNIFLLNFNNFYILNDFYKSKYSWLNHYDDVNNEISLNYINLNYNSIFFKKIFLKNSNSLSNLIKMKKNSSIFKKNSDLNYSILNYVNFLKIKYENKNFKGFLGYNNSLNGKNLDTKNFDFSRKLNLLIKSNRFILKKFYNIKYYRKFSFSKNIKKICNLRKFDLIFNLENNALNTVMKCDIFFSISDCIWFFKNSLISINSKIVKDFNQLIHTNDIIIISFNSFYFSFYKEKTNKIINNLYKLGLKIWSFNKNRNLNLNLKENYPKWVDNYKFFKKDIPLNIELDYVTMTIVFLDYDFNYKNLNYYNFKFINLYLNRLYNWKYVI